MSTVNTISITSLILSSSLVFIAIFVSSWQKLGLEKDIVVSVIRAVVQLVLVGYILKSIFGSQNPLFTSLLLVFMIANAAYNAAKRGPCIRFGRLISFVAITIGTSTTLLALIVTKTLHFEAYQVIPVSGMIIGNAMVALGLSYNRMSSDFKTKRDEVETKLSLGADRLPASIDIIRDAIKAGMIPMIDSTKTLGILSLPGMMTGLILAGVSPIEAIKYQIMVTFMLLSATSITVFLANYLSYTSFFNKRKQLIDLK